MLEIQRAVDESIVILLKRYAPQSSDCTDVLDSIERISHTPYLRAATIITDGRENCVRTRKIAPPDHHIQLVVMLVASNKDSRGSSGRLFERRKENLLRAAPWITVIPWFEFSDGVLVK